jgi:hypothetical protein
MWRVTICTADVVAPVFAAAEFVVLFLACMARKARLRDRLGRFVLKRNDLRWIAFFAVSLAGTVTRFATRHLSFPTADG